MSDRQYESLRKWLPDTCDTNVTDGKLSGIELMPNRLDEITERLKRVVRVLSK